MTGTAAATNAPTEVSANDLPSSVVYLGQELEVGVTGSDNGDFEVDNEDTVFFYEIEQGEDTRLVDTETVEDGKITLDTSVLDDGGQFAINNRSSYREYQTEFAILTQEFDVESSQETVTEDDEEVTFDVFSNRNPDYNVTISADGLDYDELNATFVHPDTGLTEVTNPNHLPLDRLGFDREEGDGVEELRNNGYITLNLSDSTRFETEEEIVANFSNLAEEEGLSANEEYEFELSVTDTTSSDNVTLQTGETTAEFGQSLYTRAAGDLAAVSVSLDATDEGWVQFADPSGSFVDVLYLSDDDGDGDVSFVMNTRLAGTNHDELSGLDSGDSDVVYYSESDTVSSYIHDESIGNEGTDVTRATFYDGSVDDANELTFAEYVQEVNGATPTEQLSRPLQPTDYDLIVANEGRFVVDDGDPTVDDEIGTAEFDLVQPSVRDVTTWTAPAGDADDASSLTALSSDLTNRADISLGDKALIRFNATGFVGAMATIDYIQNGNDIDEGLSEGYQPNVLHELAGGDTDWQGEGIQFSFEGERKVNRDRNELDVSSASENEVYALVTQQTAEDNVGSLGIVVDTDAEPFTDGLSDGEEFDTELRYVAPGSEFRFTAGREPLGGRSGDTSDPAYPYFGSSVRENVTEAATISVEEQAVTFSNTDGETVQLAPNANALVSGRTNVAPGSTARVSVRLTPPDQDLPDEDPSFLAREQIEIEDDGSFSTELDLSSRVVGEEGYLTFTVGDDQIGSYDVVFRNLSQVQSKYFDVGVEAPKRVAANETFNVSATVTNTGDQSGTGELALSVAGETAVRGVFDLDRGEFESLSENVVAGAEADTISITASTQDATANATVNVTGTNDRTNETNATTPDTETTTSPDGATATNTPAGGQPNGTSTDTGGSGNESGLPNFVVGGAVLALVSGGVVLFRRWNRV
ncbi:BGTF surface domain-containing protein [Halorientalis salina]|uniref:BGTF surface domain-containing protein n=1 Tax=Halorientalis salina TaxID=2932266 RepID=UPI0010AC404B|nr:BGTF surface domain-containing protein [Halorientalis salina]